VRRTAVRCEVCGREPPEIEGLPFGKAMHAHHIHPRALGGPDSQENLVDLCHTCHEVAGAAFGGIDKRPWYGPSTREQFIKDMKLVLDRPDVFQEYRLPELLAACDISKFEDRGPRQAMEGHFVRWFMRILALLKGSPNRRLMDGTRADGERSAS
jgi:hypothetical protein